MNCLPRWIWNIKAGSSPVNEGDTASAMEYGDYERKVMQHEHGYDAGTGDEIHAALCLSNDIGKSFTAML